MLDEFAQMGLQATKIDALIVKWRSFKARPRWVIPPVTNSAGGEPKRSWIRWSWRYPAIPKSTLQWRQQSDKPRPAKHNRGKNRATTSRPVPQLEPAA